MKRKEIPSVSILGFYANAARILKNPLPFHHENFTNLGETFQIKIGLNKRIIFSRDAEFAEYVLQKNQKNYAKSPIQTKDLAKYVGHGLLTSNGEHWKRQRKLIQPAFHKKQLAGLLDSLDSAIQQELEKIETNKEIDIFPIFNDLAFQTVVKSLFSSAAGQKEINRLQFITEAAQKMLVKELRQPYKHWWFKLGGEIEKTLKLTGEAREILKNIIEQRRISGKRENDLLDMLLDARYDDGSPMDDEQLIDEMLILFTAGHETTSNALTFTTQLIAKHPNVQQKLFKEVTTAKAESSNLFEFLQQCTFTRQVIEESMRLYPPAYFIDRINLEDDEFNGMQIPKGSSLLFSFYEIHRSEKHWEDPEKFNPERFAENTNHSTYYAPFGSGPRKCIGNNFAMYEMILAIADLVLKYEIMHKESPIEILPLITLKPKNAILEFKRR